jgi:MoaD family protein
MTKVQIPVVLRPATGGEKVVEAHGATLAEVLASLYAHYPELKQRLRVEEGLSPFVNVYVNGEDVRTGGGAATQIADGDTITILPAMAGG